MQAVARWERFPVTSSFPYSSFWEHATRQSARSFEQGANHTVITLAQRPCPKVFVYNLTAPLSDVEPSLTLESAFGESAGLGGQIRDTNEFSLAKILLYRLMHSSVCRTDDPQQA